MYSSLTKMKLNTFSLNKKTDSGVVADKSTWFRLFRIECREASYPRGVLFPGGARASLCDIWSVCGLIHNTECQVFHYFGHWFALSYSCLIGTFMKI